MIDPIRMPYLAWSTNSGLWKASPLIKRDIVNPIPPKSATPVMCFQLAPCGSELRPNFTINHEKSRIPINLPKTRPENTPIDTGLMIELKKSLPMMMPELASANRGIMAKATHG